MKDPAFLFYPSDFITGTQFMNMKERGKYITLLCLQHQKGHLSEKHMFSICSAHDEEVLCKFVKDKEGRYYNERLEEEKTKRSKYGESRRKNAMGKHKITTSNSVKKDESICKAYAEHMEDINININKDIDIDNIENKELLEGDGKYTDEWTERLKKKTKEYLGKKEEQV